MAAPTQSLVRRSWLRPRFSLRMLLLAFTGFAIGFPIWYRWPYRESELKYPGRNGVPDKTKPAYARVVTTWQRDWGGGRQKHGPRVTYHFKWNGRTVEHFTRGVLHGHYTQYVNDFIQVSGQYDQGEMDGTWISRATAEKGQDTSHWRRGKRHGLYDCDWPEQNRHDRFQFVDGRLTHFMDKPIGSRLLAQVANCEVSDGPLADAIDGQGFKQVQLVGMPLGYLCKEIETRLGFPVTIDSTVSDPEIHVSFPYDGVDFPSALILSTLWFGLDWEYRDGTLVVISRQSEMR